MLKNRFKINQNTLKNGLNKVKDFTKKGSKIAIPILMAVMQERSTNNLIDEIQFMGSVDYNDAVNAISRSNMFSVDKAQAIKLVKRNETSEYYKAIISGVKSTMFSVDKVQAIKNMNTNAEKSDN